MMRGEMEHDLRIQLQPLTVQVIHSTDAVLTEILRALKHQLGKIMAQLDDVVAKVTNLGTVEDSVVQLLTDLKAKLDAAGTDPAKLQALSDAIDAQTQKLSDAVTANTPAA